jgi:hypothetical protein
VGHFEIADLEDDKRFNERYGCTRVQVDER